MKKNYITSNSYTCKQTGFDVIESNEWVFNDPATGYSLEASLIDQSILHVNLKGDINFRIYKKQQLFIDNILNALLENGEKIILLHDYKDLFIKSMKARLDYAKWILKHKHQISELIFYNVSSLNELYIKAGTLFNQELKSVILFDDYKASTDYIKTKREITKNKSNSIFESKWTKEKLEERINNKGYRYITNNNWTYKSKINNFQCSHKVFEDNIIYRELLGEIDIEDQRITIKTLDSIITEYQEGDNKFTLLISITKASITYLSRRTFFYWIKLNQHRINTITYVGADQIFASQIKFYSIFFNKERYKLVDKKENFFKSKHNTSKDILQEHNKQKNNKNHIKNLFSLNNIFSTSKDRYIKELEDKLQKAETSIEEDNNSLIELYKVLGRISWDDTYVHKPDIVSEKNKYAEVFEIVTMLQYDIQEIINEKEGLVNKAQASELMKTTFLANMSHEIRTPMNAIMGFSSILLEEKNLNPEALNYIKIIDRNARQLIVLINDIIDFSKIEAGQISINRQNNSINQFVKTIIESFKINPKLITNSLKLDYTLYVEDDDSWAYFDEFRLGQVLRNLIQNAIKFTEVGSINVSYTIKDSKIIFTVKDTGIGIDEKQKEEIFKRFLQIDNSNSRKYGGNGLGLSICKGLCQLMKGRVYLLPNKNIGSTFIFEIPYQKAGNKKKSTRIY